MHRFPALAAGLPSHWQAGTDRFSYEVFSVQVLELGFILRLFLGWKGREKNRCVCNHCVPPQSGMASETVLVFKDNRNEPCVSGMDLKAQTVASLKMTNCFTLHKKPQKIHTHPRLPQALSFASDLQSQTSVI